MTISVMQIRCYYAMNYIKIVLVIWHVPQEVYMTRREYREHVFKMLFRVEFHDPEELDEQDVLYLEDSEELTDREKDEIRERVSNIIDKIPYIDSKINEKTQGWKTDRFGKVELSIIRLAIYEIEFDNKIPAKVSVNEAIELAKKFSGDNAPAFVNGVLKNFIN